MPTLNQATLDGLAEIFDHVEPFGPPHCEDTLKSDAIFLALYQTSNYLHERAIREHPSFVVGRRGAGKTTFLVGTALSSGSLTIRLRSEDVYTELDSLLKEHSIRRGALTADSIAYMWEVILAHAAFVAVTRYRTDEAVPAQRTLWDYVSGIGPPLTIKNDDVIATTIQRMRNALLDESIIGSFRRRCHEISSAGVSFAEATAALHSFRRESGIAVEVVVDNLEDLGTKIQTFREPIGGLLRFVARSKEADSPIEVDFDARFCFPTETLPALYRLAANAEKDLRSRLNIVWHARELLHIAGNRLAIYIIVNNLQERVSPAWQGLSSADYPLDEIRAVDFLRAHMPQQIRNGLGVDEDPVGYILRHTQLTPRHLIVILNSVFSNWFSDRGGMIDSARIVQGVQDAEEQLSMSTSSSYEVDFPGLSSAIQKVRNQIPLASALGNLHKIYNECSGKRSGLDFDQFIEALFSIGVLGIADSPDPLEKRYRVARFAYTDPLPVPNEDDIICVHPLFLRLLHDSTSLGRLAARDDYMPVYPHGCDPESQDLRRR